MLGDYVQKVRAIMRRTFLVLEIVLEKDGSVFYEDDLSKSNGFDSS